MSATTDQVAAFASSPESRDNLSSSPSDDPSNEANHTVLGMDLLLFDPTISVELQVFATGLLIELDIKCQEFVQELKACDLEAYVLTQVPNDLLWNDEIALLILPIGELQWMSFGMSSCKSTTGFPTLLWMCILPLLVMCNAQLHHLQSSVNTAH